MSKGFVWEHQLQIDQHVNEDGSTSLEKIRAKIDAYIKVKFPVSGDKTGPTPMKIDELQKQLAALQGKNKGGKMEVPKVMHMYRMYNTHIRKESRARARVSNIITRATPKATSQIKRGQLRLGRALRVAVRKQERAAKVAKEAKDPRHQPARRISKEIVASVEKGAIGELTVEPVSEPKGAWIPLNF